MVAQHEILSNAPIIEAKIAITFYEGLGKNIEGRIRETAQFDEERTRKVNVVTLKDGEASVEQVQTFDFFVDQENLQITVDQNSFVLRRLGKYGNFDKFLNEFFQHLTPILPDGLHLRSLQLIKTNFYLFRSDIEMSDSMNIFGINKADSKGVLHQKELKLESRFKTDKSYPFTYVIEQSFVSGSIQLKNHLGILKMYPDKVSTFDKTSIYKELLTMNDEIYKIFKSSLSKSYFNKLKSGKI